MILLLIFFFNLCTSNDKAILKCPLIFIANNNILFPVDVPGCEPYREYLYTNLRDQPIWHALRFWNAAFFDAVQCERSHRPVPKINNLRRNNSKDSASSQAKWTIDTTEENVQILKEDQIFLQNICFGQLG